MNHSAGDTVKVKDNLYFHCFKLGTEVKIKVVREASKEYVVTDGIKRQLLTDEELERL